MSALRSTLGARRWLLASLAAGWLGQAVPAFAEDPPPPPPPADGFPGGPAPGPRPPGPPTPIPPGGGGGGGGGEGGEDGADNLGADPNAPKPPKYDPAATITLDWRDASLRQLAEYFAKITGKNFLFGDERDLKEKVTLISHKPVKVSRAYDIFLQALDLHGYTTVTIGDTVRIVKSAGAAQTPIGVGQGGNIPYNATYVTQIIPLENVSVSDLNSVVTSLASPDAKVISYAPSNTFIIVDNAHNLRRVYDIISDLDVAAPKSRLAIVPIRYASADEIKNIIEQLYAVASSASAASASPEAASSRRRPRANAAPAAPAANTGVTAGSESKYISKVLSDERTNSLIVLANEEGHKAVADLVKELDVDVDLSSRSQIHVVYLEHAKAEDVSQVLANLSQSSRTGSASRTSNNNAAARRPNGAPPPAPGTPGAEEGGVTAAFDSGMRIAADENTNSLVIIASDEDFRVIKKVIDQLDIRRRQVLIDVVLLELGSSDSAEVGIAVHGPLSPSEDAVGLFGAQLNGSSLGLTQDLLQGLAVGILGPTVSVPFSAGTGGVTNVDVPAFGIVLNAIRSNSAADIVASPNIMTLDNEEAEITVGRKVPFPTQQSFSQVGLPIVSYQRQDVATKLKVTPRVNSSNLVTLEVEVETSEIEEDNRGLDVSTAGFITSTRALKQSVLIGDNQTAVIGGLVGTTTTKVETKVPVLGDLPLIGALFRGSRTQSRKTNLMVFLTPHIIDEEEDIYDVMLVKEAQRQEFMRRFYGKSRDQQMSELRELLKYSANFPDIPTVYPEEEPAPRGDVEITGPQPDAPPAPAPAPAPEGN